MKKYFLAIFVSLLFFFPLQTSAINIGGGEGSFLEKAGQAAEYGDADELTFAKILGGVVQTLLSFIGIIFLALIVYAGFLWMTARGDESQIEKSKSIITAAVIGLVITLAAYSITAFVVPKILEVTAGTPATSATP